MLLAGSAVGNAVSIGVVGAADGSAGSIGVALVGGDADLGGAATGFVVDTAAASPSTPWVS